MQEPFEEIPKVNDFSRYRLGWFFLIVGIAVAVAGAPALVESQFGYSIVGSHGTLRDASETDVKPEEADKVQPPLIKAISSRVTPPTVVRELDALTSSPNLDTLIGKKVDLTVPVLGRANDQAFWIGSDDHQMLVAVRRDYRSAEQRYYGEPRQNGVADIQAGQQARITGTIQPLPDREETYSWELTTHDVEQLEARPIYIDADSVQPAR